MLSEEERIYQMEYNHSDFISIYGSKLTILMMKSFEDDATKALFELTAKSVMSPF